VVKIGACTGEMLKMKTVILAGGSGGLGVSVARSVARQGYKPVLGFLKNAARANDLARELSCPAIGGDISEASVRQNLLSAAAANGELYGLVVMTGDPARVPIETATLDDLLNSMRINFAGPVLLARDFAAAAGERDASIVLLSTMQAIGVFAGSTTYAAPKAALVHAAKILARQWRIRVNIVCPWRE
jgi:NAD(P)-dependent dehydrogenase (short-subunit alcohol dehydrogenase family)